MPRKGAGVGNGKNNLPEIGSKTGYKFKEGVDLDLRGTGNTYKDALNEAFKRTGVPKEDFVVTKWAKDANGKSFPVEWRAKGDGEDILRVLEECFGFEFYLTNFKLDYLLTYDHHNVLGAVGDAAEHLQRFKENENTL